MQSHLVWFCFLWKHSFLPRIDGFYPLMIIPWIFVIINFSFDSGKKIEYPYFSHRNTHILSDSWIDSFFTLKYHFFYIWCSFCFANATQFDGFKNVEEWEKKRIERDKINDETFRHKFHICLVKCKLSHLKCSNLFMQLKP